MQSSADFINKMYVSFGYFYYFRLCNKTNLEIKV